MGKDDDTTTTSDSDTNTNANSAPALDADTVRAIVKDEVSAIPQGQEIDEDELIEKIADRVAERFPEFDADGITSKIESLFRKHSKTSSGNSQPEVSGGWLSRLLS